MNNLTKRIDYIKQLIAKVKFGKFEEKRFWLPGFFNQKNFITTLLSIVARNETISLDRLRIDYTIEGKKKGRTMTMAGRKRNKTFQIYGLWMYGAKWD